MREHDEMGFVPHRAWPGTERVLVLGAAPQGLIQRSARVFDEYASQDVDRYHEFDVVIIDPRISGLVAHSGILPRGDSSWTDLVTLPRIQSIFSRRRDELRQLLATGGTIIVLLRAPSELWAETNPRQYDRLDALELLGDPRWLERTVHAGTSGPPVDADDPLAAYLRLPLRYEVTVRGGMLADEGHSYPLATSHDGLTTAFVEYVGRGRVYWVPPPGRADPQGDDPWKVLAFAAIAATGPRGDLFDDIADDEELARSRSAAERALRDHGTARRAIDDGQHFRERLLREDAELATAVQHFRTASAAPPRRALDQYARMHEIVARAYGGKYQAAAALGYHHDLPDAFTAPANQPEYQVRHASAGAPAPVADDVLVRAHDAAQTIIRAFFKDRAAKLRRSP